MPIRVSCPSCSATLSAPDTAAGRTVKCPKCTVPMVLPIPDEPEPVGGEFEVVEEAPPLTRARRVDPEPATVKRRIVVDDIDDEDDDDRPRRKRRKPEKKGISPLLIIGLLGFGLLAIAAIAVAIWYFLPVGGKNPIVNIPGLSSPSTNWVKFNAPNGSFSADFPDGEPQAGANSMNSMMPQMPGAGGMPAGGPGGMMDVGIWARDSGTLVFQAGYVSMPEPIASMMTLDQMFSNVPVNDAKKGVEGMKVENITFAGHPGKKLTAKQGPQSIETRFIKVKGFLFMVSVVTRTPDGKNDTLTEEFFNRFQIKTVPEPKKMDMPGMPNMPGMPKGFDDFFKGKK